jgi:hypothetical protein
MILKPQLAILSAHGSTFCWNYAVKTFAPFFLCLAGAWAACGQPVQVVVPNNLANVEGNSSVSQPFNSPSFRFQQVFDASQFAVVGSATARIDRISFRIDGAATSDVVLFFGGSSVTLSTTQRGPDGLSPVFADNRGPNAVTVWNGAFSTGGIPGLGGPPYAFHETFQFTTPFFYRPSQGNLLLDVAGAGGQAFLPGSLDAQAVAGDSVSWVWSADGNSATGVAATLGLVTRFDIVIIPEPSIWIFGATGLVFLLRAFRRG